MGGFRWLACGLVVLAGCVDLARPPGLATVTPQNRSDGSPADVRPAEGDGRRDAEHGDAPDLEVPGPGPVDSDAGPVDSDPGSLDAQPDGPAPASLPVSSACAGGGECASGHCVDGVCCDQACMGLCQACDLVGSSGRCSSVPAGQDPDVECAEDAVMLCRQDGTCDGQGACRKYPVGTPCAPPRCQGSTEYGQSECSAAGVCMPGGSRSCSPMTCSGDSCRKTCTVTEECTAGFICDAGVCKVKSPAGTACTSALQCASGICVDGVCCSTPCTGLCQACNLPTAAGTCTSVPAAQDPARECLADAAGSCGKIGGCDGRGACRVEAAGVGCGAAASCSAGTETGARACNGAGVCQAAVTRSCAPYLCSGAGCATTCTAAADCAANHKCTGGACLPLKISSLVVHDTDPMRAAGWSVQLNFQIGVAGAHPWVDWPNTYVASMDAPGNILLGNEWIRLAAESKKYTGGPQATLTLAAAADVYMIVDDRWGVTPAFTAGFTNTGFEVRVFESTTRPALPFSVFVRNAPAGPVALPQIGASTAYNYLIVVR